MEEEVKQEKPISKKELARRKKLSALAKKRNEKRRREGHRRYLAKVKAEAAARRKEKEKEKKRLRKEKQKERERARRAKNKGGRPRKPGPKKKRRYKSKKKAAPISKKLPPFKYKIIACSNGVQTKFIGRYRTSAEAYEVFNILKKSDRDIVFPKTIAACYDRMENMINEYILIEQSDRDSSVLRNEYGKLVEHRTNLEGWTILDKFQYRKEEDFWVWGYDNRSERKTFKWIYENIIMDGIESRMDFKRMLIYKNKIVIRDDNRAIDLVFCKDEGDAVRFYNLVEEWARRDKMKQIICLGDWSAISPKRKELENELMELTGWTRKKVQMKATTYYMK